jgi:hypothetical protein
MVLLSFPSHFILKIFKYSAKLKEFYSERLYTHHWDSTSNMLLDALVPILATFSSLSIH